MEWKSEYELGIDEIDNQHKKLVGIINDYNHSISDKNVNSSAEIENILVYLINYTSFHFKAEEEVMAKLVYPELVEHIEIHEELISKLREILIKMKRKESYTPIEFYYFLMSWLNDHILGEDLKIGAYSKKANHVLITPKLQMKNPESIVEHIKVKLNELDELFNKKLINTEDLELRRIIYLEDLFDKYLFDNIKSFTNILKLLLLLIDKDIIDSLEKDKLYYSLLLEKKLKKMEEEISDDNIYSEINNLLANIKK